MAAWYYDTCCIKSVGFTWWNLPVIKSLARVHRIYEAMNIYCVLKRLSSALLLLPFSSVGLDCESFTAENDPADDQMPSITISLLL